MYCQLLLMFISILFHLLISLVTIKKKKLKDEVKYLSKNYKND